MPQLFFDITDHQGSHRDQVGMGLPDIRAARRVVQMTLGRLAATQSNSGTDSFDVTINVRDQFDRMLMTAGIEGYIQQHTVEPVEVGRCLTQVVTPADKLASAG